MYIVALIILTIFTYLISMAIDVRRRARELEGKGFVVKRQLLSPSSILVNVLPRNGPWIWLFPYRFPSVEEDMTKELIGCKDRTIALVSYRQVQIYTSDVETIKMISSKKQNHYKPYKFYRVFGLYGDNIFSVVDEDRGGSWEYHRNILKSSFCERNYMLAVESMNRHLESMMLSWEKDANEGIDIGYHAINLMLAVLGDSVLGVDLSKADEVVEGRDRTMHRMSLRCALHGVCKYLFHRALIPSTFHRFLPFHSYFDELEWYMRDICEERLTDEKTQRNDILSSLMNESREEKDHEKRIRAMFPNLFIMMAAGHETSAHTLAWVIRLLAYHQNIQDKVYDEVKAVIGNRQPEYKDVRELVYTGHVINECLRMFPPGAEMPKQNRDPVTIRGVTMPENSIYAVMICSVHNDPMHWKDPHLFAPERFQEKAPEEMTFIPYSMGRRRCMGMNFAQLELKVAVATIVGRSRITLPLDADIPHLFDKTTLLTAEPKHPIKFVLSKREMA